MRRIVASLAALTLLVAACGGQDPDNEVDVIEAPADDTLDEPVDDAADDPAEDTADDPADAGSEDGAGEDADMGGTDDLPEPDPSALADPCGEHEGREGDAFLDVVAPVDEQRAGDELELVGCSNVPEATVLYRLLDGDGRTLDEGFTTAECGTGCVGAFEETIDLSAAEGEPVVQVQVFWESPRDGSEQDLVERTVVLEG